MGNKLLINDTIRVAKKESETWLNWMKTIVLPLAFKGGYIESYRITRILGDNGEDGESFACQYICSDNKHYSDFINNFDPKIQGEQKVRFAGKFGSFRSVLEIIDEG